MVEMEVGCLLAEKHHRSNGKLVQTYTLFLTKMFVCFVGEVTVNRLLSQMTQIYEIWERQADRYYEMKKYLDETDKKVDRVQARI